MKVYILIEYISIYGSKIVGVYFTKTTAEEEKKKRLEMCPFDEYVIEEYWAI